LYSRKDFPPLRTKGRRRDQFELGGCDDFVGESEERLIHSLGSFLSLAEDWILET